MNKPELIRLVQYEYNNNHEEKINIQELNDLYETIVNVFTDLLSNGESIEITKFGKFDLRSRVSRVVISPTTGTEITIPKTNVVHFTPYKALKKSVNE